MKTQKRPFVIERKLGRRRLTTQPTSIWGDTDLKALVQKVEADAPHLFEQSIAAESHDTLDRRADPGSDPVGDSTEPDGKQPNAALSIELEQVQIHAGHVAFSAVQPLNDASSDEHGPKLAKRQRKANVLPRPPRAESTAGEPSFSAQTETHTDELEALDAENRRLKRLLGNHLRQQNMQLRALLERFGR